MKRLASLIMALCLSVLPEVSGAQTAPQEIRIGVIARKPPPPPTYSFDPVPEDEGFAGARVATRDNATTGAFTGQRFVLDEVPLAEDESPLEAARKLVDGGAGILVVNLPADELLAVADGLKERDAVIVNIGAPDDRLRNADCRANLFHVAPSRAMLTDALAQFLATKSWRKLLLIVGPQPADKLYAEAMKRAARKFGLAIAAEKTWDLGPLARAKADSPTRAEALALTEGVYEVAIVADEAGDFGDYIPYRTRDPRLVAGTQGLVATTWHPVHEVWGAAQLQNRFSRAAKRPMRPLDYHAWVAVRAVGEAATRLKRTSPREIGRFMLADGFDIAAFKGVPLSFRSWNQQLRQPILIVQPRSLVSVAPEPGFLHQRTPLDSLGFDEPESACRLAQGSTR